MTSLSPDAHPLRLATGSHQAGTGKGCAMNVISWENGDTTITDTPACSDRMLARIVQRVNDMICSHREGDLLCPACSIAVLDLGHRTIGTGAELGLSPLDRHRAWVRVAADQARQVQHLNTDPRVEAAISAAETWADNPSAASAAASAEASYAASAAASAYAAAAAASAAYAAAAAAAAASAAAASAEASYDATTRLELAHRAVTVFREHAGLTEPPAPDTHTITTAINQMLEVTQ